MGGSKKMVQIQLTNISGATYPIQVYIADVYGNNQTLIATITSGPVPPIQTYTSVIPPIFQTAPEIMLRLVDANNCSIFKILTCNFRCEFNITIELESCIFNIIITETPN